MKHNVKFSPEQRKNLDGSKKTENIPLFADIRFAGSRLFYFTGYRIDAIKWDFSKERMRKNASGKEGATPVQYNIINNRLDDIQTALRKLFEGLPDKQAIIKGLDGICLKSSIKKVEADSLEFLSMFQSYIDNSRLAEGRKKHAVSALNHWQRFAKVNRVKLSFANITPEMLGIFERWMLAETKVIEGTIERKELRGVNTLHSILAITRTFWNYAAKKLPELHYPFKSYTIPSEVYGTPIYLTLDERDLLFAAVLTTERLSRVRDMFVFQCLIGCRVGDLCKLGKSNISNDVLSYIPRKTKEGNPVTVTIPLAAKAIEIINRYDMPDGRLMPFISGQKYNDYLKDLFKEVGLTRTITRQHPTTREQENVRLCDIACSHMARKTFVGNMFGKVDSAIIASMSGHVADSKAFGRYHDVKQELQRNAIDLIE